MSLKLVLNTCKKLSKLPSFHPHRPIQTFNFSPLFGPSLFNFSTQSKKQTSDDLNQSQEQFYFYRGWLQQPEYIQKFEMEAKKLFENLQAKEQLNFESLIELFIFAEQKILNSTQEEKFCKWQVRKQLRKAIILNLKYKRKKSSQISQYTKTFQDCQDSQTSEVFNFTQTSRMSLITDLLRSITKFQKYISEVQIKDIQKIIEQTMKMPDVTSKKQIHFQKQESNRVKILEVIKNSFQTKQKQYFSKLTDKKKQQKQFVTSKISGQTSQTKQFPLLIKLSDQEKQQSFLSDKTKSYLIDQFKCLFEIKAEKQNYNQNYLQSTQGRFDEGMVGNGLIFNISPVTVTIFKSIFEKNTFTLFSMSATQRIGKSIALLLSRILSSYSLANKIRYLFFSNLDRFDNIAITNLIINQMIRHSLWDRLQRKDFKLLNQQQLTQIKKQVNQNAQNAQNTQNQQMLNKLNQTSKYIYQTIKGIEYDEKTKYKDKTSQRNKIYQKQQNIPVKIQFPNKGPQNFINLIYFRNLLNLIKQIKKQISWHLILDQFNYVGRFMYKIMQLSSENISDVAQQQINKSLQSLTLISHLISACNCQKVRFFSSINNFTFEKLLYLFQDLTYNKSNDAFTVFGFTYSSQNAKYQLQFQLLQIYQNLSQYQKKKNKVVYDKLLDKKTISYVINACQISLNASQIKDLAKSLLNISPPSINISNLDTSSLNQLLEFYNQVNKSLNLVYVKNNQDIFQLFSIFIFQSTSNVQKIVKFRLIGSIQKVFKGQNYLNFKDFNQIQKYLARKTQSTILVPDYHMFVGNILTFFSFYYSYKGGRIQSIGMKFNLGQKTILKQIVSKYKQSINSPQSREYFTQFQQSFKDLKPLKSSKQALLGNILQQQVFRYLQIYHKQKVQIVIGKHNFLINNIKQLNKSLDLVKQTNQFLQQAQADKYTKLIKCMGNQRAYDDLILRFNKISEDKGSIQYYFIEIGINAQVKLANAPSNFNKAIFQKKKNQNKSNFERIQSILVNQHCINGKQMKVNVLQKLNFIILAHTKKKTSDLQQIMKKYSNFNLEFMNISQFNQNNKTNIQAGQFSQPQKEKM